MSIDSVLSSNVKVRHGKLSLIWRLCVFEFHCAVLVSNVDWSGCYPVRLSPSYSWVPVFADRDQRLAVMSIGFLLAQQDDAVVWRGPKKNGETILQPLTHIPSHHLLSNYPYIMIWVLHDKTHIISLITLYLEELIWRPSI